MSTKPFDSSYQSRPLGYILLQRHQSDLCHRDYGGAAAKEALQSLHTHTHSYTPVCEANLVKCDFIYIVFSEQSSDISSDVPNELCQCACDQITFIAKENQVVDYSSYPLGVIGSRK